MANGLWVAIRLRARTDCQITDYSMAREDVYEARLRLDDSPSNLNVKGGVPPQAEMRAQTAAQ
eukprot:13784019-Alexandrium_andersonii.AAC.1